jgi:hypothetical protein
VTDLTVAGVRAYLEGCDRALLAELEAAPISDVRLSGRWTATQIMDHLNRTELLMYPIWTVVPRLRRFPGALRLMDRANAALWRGAGMSTVVPTSRLGPANAEEGRFRAPAFLRPSVTPALEVLLKRRTQIRGRTMRAIAAVDEVTLNRLHWSHPLMGSYSLMEFAQFLGVHERHHLPQIARLSDRPRL